MLGATVQNVVAQSGLAPAICASLSYINVGRMKFKVAIKDELEVIGRRCEGSHFIQGVFAL